jgi:hypothetical protein
MSSQNFKRRVREIGVAFSNSSKVQLGSSSRIDLCKFGSYSKDHSMFWEFVEDLMWSSSV